MRTWMKIVILLIACMLGAAIVTLWNDLASPVLGSELAVANLNGGNADWQAMNFFQKYKGWVSPIVALLIAGLAVALALAGKKKRTCTCDKDGCCTNERGWNNVVCVPIILLMLSLTYGCRQYDVPEYVEVAPSQTAFVIPLEGETKAQAKFDSAAYLETRKVAAKRIQVPHRWNQRGRLWIDGEWMDTVRVIMVDRAPVTREWKSDGNNKTKDNAIWTESSDSVGFSLGWSCTAFIQEEDAATFLYMYPSGSLAAVMDEELRGRIQQVAAEVSAKWPLDTLRTRKQDILDGVRSNVTAFFSARGITVTTLGMFGGMEYENEDIQKAIDATFINQQEKVNAAALLEAQSGKNERIKSEANALAEAARVKAQGEADGIESINKALAKAANNPQLIQLRQLEVDMKRAGVWNGVYPTTVAGSGANVWVGLGTDVNPAAGTSKQ
jgi:hypothetical protein